MIVIDASALVELLTGTEAGRQIAGRISNPSESLHAPQLAFVEVTQALRRLVALRELTVTEAETAVSDLQALGLEPYDHEPLLERIWALRDNVSAYDATYVALAEALGCVLISCDAKLAASPPARGIVELF